MSSFLFTIVSFVVALGVLITVHEFGHFWVARKLGVKVLKFSVGFGKALWSRTSPVDGTEYVVAAIPLGGYVTMLDEREKEVPPEELAYAFNRQSLWVRTAIVAAGPIFNFIFAIIAFWIVFMAGETGLRPVVAEVESGSIAHSAGFEVADRILSVGKRETIAWEHVSFAVLAASIDKEDMQVRVQDARGNERIRMLQFGSLSGFEAERDPMTAIGLSPQRPIIPPIIGGLIAGEAAAQAGLQVGDRIVSVDGEQVSNWIDLVRYIQNRPATVIAFTVDRAGSEVEIPVRTGAKQEDAAVGYIGAQVENYDHLLDEYRVEIHLGPLDALGAALEKTGDLSWLILKMIGQMLTGEASVKNIGGPVSIAQAAGETASYGLIYFLRFLAGISISLGVLNLLPIPILDGGHLLFFAIEAIKGSPPSERLQMEGQRIGMLLLMMLMGLAFYVDFTRLLG
ncbi:Intramembrane protease RasP/YluC, implicated in cell division based on FtsL cleavage [hydrothermal vent metagenome]|uniref:Intramembrane protease RasP/YluC, implicated in cell division based on FtsL cleavage n=1 Tax=hydrothermal vent metagenome TaxID=652676 RepID=A0A3B1BGU9_9ZZZZ